MTTRADFIAEARTWLETPYGHQGRQKGVWADCVGVPLCAARNVGLFPRDFDINGYGVIPNPFEMTRLLDLHCDRVRKGEEKPGDVGLMKDPDFGGRPRHLFLLTDSGTIIHAHSGATPKKEFRRPGLCKEERYHDNYRKSTVQFWRIRGMEDD